LGKYEVRWAHRARKFFENSEKIYQKRFERMLKILEENPYYYVKAIKRLSGDLSGLYRFSSRASPIARHELLLVAQRPSPTMGRGKGEGEICGLFFFQSRRISLGDKPVFC